MESNKAQESAIPSGVLFSEASTLSSDDDTNQPRTIQEVSSSIKELEIGTQSTASQTGFSGSTSNQGFLAFPRLKPLKAPILPNTTERLKAPKLYLDRADENRKINTQIFNCFSRQPFLRNPVSDPLAAGHFNLQKRYLSRNYMFSCRNALNEYISQEDGTETLPDSELLQDLHCFSQAHFAESLAGRSVMESFPLSSLIAFGILAEELIKYESENLEEDYASSSPEVQAISLCQLDENELTIEPHPNSGSGATFTDMLKKI